VTRVRAVKADGLVAGCYSCDQQERPSLPPREDIVHTDHWRFAHAFNSTLRGWLVLVPTRHVLSFTELSPAAADELGGLVHRMSIALERVTGSVKTYLMQFSEADGFSHLHVHLVPRLADHPADARGPAVFALMAADERDWMGEPERDEVSLALRAAFARA
jgi:diadenosine tetraphosphate (Ap4A) HIT family hydrolase